MSHDPLCQRPNLTVGCDCDLIARVRADEREQIRTWVDAIREHRNIHVVNCLYCRAIVDFYAAIDGREEDA